MVGQKIKANKQVSTKGFQSKAGQINEYALIFFSALLVVLSFPKFSWSILAWVSLVPFFKSLEDKPARTRFRLGYLFGIVYNLGIFYWVTHSMRYYGGLDPFTSYSYPVAYGPLFGPLYRGLWLALGVIPFKGSFPPDLGPLDLGWPGIPAGPSINRLSLGIIRLFPI